MIRFHVVCLLDQMALKRVGYQYHKNKFRLVISYPFLNVLDHPSDLAQFILKNQKKAMSNDATKPSDESLQPQVESESAPEATPPEPWTPERVVEWNNYYNIYVAIGLLVLVVVNSLNLFEESAIFASLRSGEITLSKGFPETTDTLSYTSEGQRWVNLGWMFDTISAASFRLGKSFAAPEKADQYGASAVTIVHAIVRLLTFLILLSIGKTKQGLWGRSLLLGLAVIMGLGAGVVGTDLWGVFFLSLLLRFMFLATDKGRSWAFWAIPAIFPFWVNFDASAGFGLLLTIGWGIGLIIGGKKFSPAFTPSKIAPIIGASIAACLINPWTVHAYGAMFRIANQYTLIPGGLFGSIQIKDPDVRNAFLLRLLSLIIIGAVTFWLNMDRFRVDRLLVFIFASLGFVIWMRYNGEFALVLAVIVGLNMEEWFADSFGSEGHLGWKWAAFSIGGRGVTILVLFGLAAQHITGYGLSEGAATFGLGFNPDRYAFEAADFVKESKLSGQVFNWNSAQGDMFLWRAYPGRKTFLDDRRNLFTESIRTERDLLRAALRDDDSTVWRPILDKYGITAVMVQAMTTSFTEESALKTLSRLNQSVNWIPIYDDGVVAIFGRSDAKAEDLAYFKANRLDADRIVYSSEDKLPAFDRPPSSASVLDKVIATKALGMVQPHAQAAYRRLNEPGKTADPNVRTLPSPAECISAIREARRAIAKKPDQTQPYRILAEAYRALHSQELALYSGVKLEPANVAQISMMQAGPTPLGLRFRQRVAAVHFAIETSPAPVSQVEREYLAALHGEMGQLMLLANAVDVAREHLRKALEINPETENAAERRAQVAQLDQAYEQMETDMNSLSLEEQANASVRINRALSIGLVNQALTDLREAEATGSSPDTILPVLIDLYCQLGMPDQAIPLIGNTGTKSMETSAGLSTYRQGLVSALLGDYPGAFVGWGNESIPVAQLDEMRRGLMAGQMWMLGELGAATRTFMEMPDQGRAVASRLFELGLVQLEGGLPKAAAESFTKALTREPQAEFGPIARYYLEKLGKPFAEVKKPSDVAAPTVPVTAPVVAPSGAVPTNPVKPSVVDPAKPKP